MSISVLQPPLRLVILGKAVCVLQNTSHVNHNLAFCIVFSDPPELSGLGEDGETLWLGGSWKPLTWLFPCESKMLGNLMLFITKHSP